MSTPSALVEEQVLSTNQIRHIKLDADEKALVLLEKQVTQLTSTTTALEAQLTKIQASLDISRSILEVATLQRDELVLQIREQRAAFGALERFPDELLVEIFVYLAFEISWASGPIKSSPARAHAPFLCAAVCKRWRRVALSAPKLWHYIAIPQLTQAPSDGARFLNYVETMLERSKSVTLVIIFDFVDNAGARHHSKLLGMLSPQLHRWRIFSARLSALRALPSILDCLRGPAPMLVFVCICGRPGERVELVDIDHHDHDTPAPRYLCRAPRLSRLWVENVPFFWPSHHEAMPALEILQFTQYALTQSFWTTVAPAAASLKRLSIYAREPPAAPAGPIHFSSLDFLAVGFHAWKLLQQFPDTFVAARLTKLYVHNGRPQDLDVFLSRLPTSLASLHLHDVAIEESDIPALRHLSSLSRLHLQLGIVTTGLFEYLTRAHERMWPSLTHLVLDGVTLLPANGDSLVQFVRSRNRRNEAIMEQSDDGVAPWTNIQSVTFSNNHNVPRWDVAEINDLLGQT